MRLPSFIMKIFIFLFLIILFVSQTQAQKDYIDSLKEKLNYQTEDTSKYKLLYAIATANMFTQADTSVEYARKSLQLAQKLKNKKKEASCLGTLCVGLTVLGNYASALEFGFKALEIFTNLKDTSSLIITNLQLMNCYKEQEDYTEALKYGYQAKQFFKTAEDPGKKGLVLSVMSSVYEKLNRLDSALYYGKQALQLYPEWSGTSLTLGDIYFKQGFLDSSLKYYRSTILFASNNGLNKYLSDIYNNMSKLFDLYGNKDSSISYAIKSITQEGIDAYPEGKLRAAIQLANLYEKEQLADSTLKYQKLIISLKDSLYSRVKTREAQNYAFNLVMHQQRLTAELQQEENKVKVYVLIGVLVIFLLIGFFLLRNNIQKQRAKEKIEKAYESLRSTQAQLIQSEKMASLGELTAGIAHEIQNPLNFVNNFSEVNNELITELKHELNSGNIKEANNIITDIESNEQKINHHGMRADAIVKSMIQHSRASAGQKESTDINALADEYLRLSYHGLRAKDKLFNATIQTDFDPTIQKIDIIPQDIGRVLLNLFNNAFYAVSEKQKHSSEPYKPTVIVRTKKINIEPGTDQFPRSHAMRSSSACVNGYLAR